LLKTETMSTYTALTRKLHWRETDDEMAKIAKMAKKAVDESIY